MTDEFSIEENQEETVLDEYFENAQLTQSISDAGLFVAAACESTNHGKTNLLSQEISKAPSIFSTIQRRFP